MADVQKDMQAKISESQMSSYQEAADKLFEAMDIITSKRVSSVGFDKTLVCTIESVENAKNGSYKVTDGTSHFKAYADTTTKYSEGQKVYVKIPGGDMNNQKIITGKYIASVDEFIPYVSALDSFVDVTDNVITASDSQFSLKANGDIPFKVIWEYNGERVTSSSSQAEKIKEIKDTLAYESEAIMADEGKSTEDKKKEIEALQKFAYNRISNLTSDAGYDAILKEIQEAQDISDKDKLLMIEDLNGITSYSGFKGYKCLGLAGSFKTSALDLRTIKGAFGLRLDVLGITGTGLMEFRRFYLDASEMFGNPYRYITFSKQEVMFDISMYAEIVQARLIFYQNNDFILEDSSRLDPSAFNADDIILQSPYVAFGFDMNSFTEDTIILGSRDSLMYSSENAPPYKDIYMRWVHDIDGKFYAIDEVEEVPEQAIIHWYRYKLEQNRSDILAGEFWAEIKDDPNLGKDLFNYTFTPNFKVDTDAFKVIIEVPSRKIITQELGMNASLLQKFGELKANNPSQGLIDGINSMIAETDMKKLSEDYTKYSGLYIQDSDAVSKDLFEQIYNIIVGERSKTKFYESEQLVFTNAIPQAIESIDLIQGLSVIIDEENYEGIYRLYDDTYNIINSTEASKLRTMKAEYSSVATGIDTLDSAEEIIWYFPVSNTMIQKPELGKEYSEEDTYIENCGRQGYVAIKRAGVDSVEKQEPGIKLIETTQKFRIKDRYVQAAHNNAIYCSIKKRGRIYEAYVLPTFGVAGSNGTDATFLLKMYENNNNEPGRQVSALTVGSSVIIVPELYDFNNQPIVITNSNKVSYKWSTGAFSGNDVIKCTPLGESKLLVSTDSLDIEDLQCFILKAEIPYEVVMNKEEVAEGEDVESRKVNLSTFLPIAVRSDVKYVELEGATWVVYENNGTSPKYYKIPYKLYGDNLTQYKDIYWEGYSPDFKVTPEEPIEGRPEPPGIKTYYPVVTPIGEFKPPKMFYQGCDNFCVNAYDADDNMVWTQPVLISQNRYGSPMLNDWDGDLTIDEKNGTILSAMIGAGVKNKDNSFSGVLMGQIGKAFQTDNIGLYGYDHGAQSFSFDVTGTATLGVSGQGQIRFDGNKGTITSGNYIEPTFDAPNAGLGMKIDLDDSFMNVFGSAGQIKLNAMTKEDGGSMDSLFKIISADGNVLMDVSDDGYLIQSNNFTKRAGTEDITSGMRIDIDKGKLESIGLDDNGNWSGDILINSTGSPYFRIRTAYKKDENSSVEQKNLILIDKNDLYLQSRDFRYITRGADGKITEYGAGTKIDIADGKITSYDFTINAYGVYGDNQLGYITIDSGAKKYPLDINNQFTVDWGGNITANYITVIGGTLGGWYVDNKGIYDYNPKSTGTRTGMALLSNGDDSDSNIRIAVGTFEITKTDGTIVGEDGEDDIKFEVQSSSGKGFFVDKDGVMKCTGATMISSTISSATINDATISRGTITNATINKAKISSGTINSATITGNCKVSGTLTGATISGGKIDGASINADGYVTCSGLKVGGTEYSMKTVTIQDGYYRPKTTKVATGVDSYATVLTGVSVTAPAGGGACTVTPKTTKVISSLDTSTLYSLMTWVTNVRSTTFTCLGTNAVTSGGE